MRDAGSASGAGAGCCGPGEDGGLKIEVGALGSVAVGDGDEKPIFKGVCAAVEICAGIVGDGFSFSGKFGSAGAETSGANFNSVGALGVWTVETGLAGSE